ncbi:Uncharacterised protein [Mycobacteroides abscessus]|nr:Uncharacterised protein [Mycobacteroides abscessus]
MNQLTVPGSIAPTPSSTEATRPFSGSKIHTHTYVPVIAGTAQATMIAVAPTPRQNPPSVLRNSATAVPSATVSTTHASANSTVLGRTVVHR